MSAPTHTATLIGATGLVGSSIFSTLLASETWTAVSTIGRRDPPGTNTKLTSIIDANVEAWPGKIPACHTVFSGLGTTRAQAGGLANQWKIDHDANVALAKAAKEKGVKTFVFISSGGTRGYLSSMAPYSKMKNGVEDAIKAAGFDNAIILKPGMLMGHREHTRTAEAIGQSIVKGVASLSPGVGNAIGQDASIVGQCAVKAAEMAAEGKAPEKYWVIEGAEIIKIVKGDAPATPAAPAAPAAAVTPAADSK